MSVLHCDRLLCRPSSSGEAPLPRFCMLALPWPKHALCHSVSMTAYKQKSCAVFSYLIPEKKKIFLKGPAKTTMGTA